MNQPNLHFTPHFADGGYYDNYGVATAVEWLTSQLTSGTLRNLSRVLLLEIRASEDDAAKSNPGWLTASLGPLLALNNVRATAQRNRNDIEVADLKSKLSNRGIAFESVAFVLSKEYKEPLSWHLNDLEKRAIVAGWNGDDTQRARRRLKCLWLTPTQWWAQCDTADMVTPAARAQ